MASDVLVVEDQLNTSGMIVEWLELYGYRARSASTLGEARRHLN